MGLKKRGVWRFVNMDGLGISIKSVGHEKHEIKDHGASLP